MSSLTPPIRHAALAAARLQRVLAVVAAVCVGCLAAGAGPALAAFPGQNGKIVFASAFGGFFEGTSDIYTMSPNGRHLLNLTPDSPANDDFPRWSADGRMIVFWSTRTGPDNPTGDQEIFVMNANGSGLRQVTKNTVDDGAPAWSPNGDRLVFHRWLADDSQADPDAFQADLITVRVNGTGERNLTRSPGSSDYQAVWSPDGREIVFARYDGGPELQNDIYTIRPDGSHLRALTATPTDEESPDWSPDGKRIAFHADAALPGEQWDIYVMRRDGGSPPTRLTTAGGYHAAWSPNGRKIVFNNSTLADRDRLFTMRADGSRQKQRTVRPGYQDNHPDWQPVPKDARAEDDDDQTSAVAAPASAWPAAQVATRAEPRIHRLDLDSRPLTLPSQRGRTEHPTGTAADAHSAAAVPVSQDPSKPTDETSVVPRRRRGAVVGGHRRWHSAARFAQMRAWQR